MTTEPARWTGDEATRRALLREVWAGNEAVLALIEQGWTEDRLVEALAADDYPNDGVASPLRVLRQVWLELWRRDERVAMSLLGHAKTELPAMQFSAFITALSMTGDQREVAMLEGWLDPPPRPPPT